MKNFKLIAFIIALQLLGLKAWGVKSDCRISQLSKFVKSSATLKEQAEFYSCFHEKKIYSVSIPALIDLVTKSTHGPFQEENLRKVLEVIPREYEPMLFKKLAGKRLFLTPETQSDLMYFYALYYFDKNNDKVAARYLSKQVGVNFDRYGQSKFLMAVMQFKNKNVDAAEAEFSYLTSGQYKTPSKEIKNKIINASRLNLARIKVQEKNFTEAVEHYRSVSYQDNKWFDGLVEMSWSMLALGDYEKAVGNAKFVAKSTNPIIYKPWLDVIQSVGLLKLCQFPEAKENIDHFNKNYSDSLERVKDFARERRNKSYYHIAAEVMSSDMDKSELKKTPKLMFYVAKNDKILAHQRLLNRLIDEERELAKFSKKFKRKGNNYAYRLSRKRLGDVTSYINHVQKKTGVLFRDELKDVISEHKKLAKLTAIVDFEIFSRSSNSITLRVAGAKFKDEMKKSGAKNSAWSYVGSEFWTDEVGKFQSFVQNKCISDTHGMKKLSKR